MDNAPGPPLLDHDDLRYSRALGRGQFHALLHRLDAGLHDGLAQPYFTGLAAPSMGNWRRGLPLE